VQQPPVPPVPADPADPADPARPVVVIGAGPAGLAAAANLRAYDVPVLVLEAGDRVGAAMRATNRRPARRSCATTSSRSLPRWARSW
jgi:cation diffusion facilitator CzcD-associated flavoprotein CzcO